MANALAIAAVSSVLKDLLTDGIIDAQLSGDVTVKVGPPPSNGIATSGAGAKSQLNLFLYQVTPNLNWRNQCLPSRNSQGARLNKSPIALDLRYLLTAYGIAQFDAEVLLGYAVQLLHEHPILSRDAIRTTFSAGAAGVNSGILPSRYQSLAASGLADQSELIKITPEYLDTEAMSRLWSSLQAKYHTSMAYHVSVVLIEREEEIAAGPPVRKPQVSVQPIQKPVIARVAPQRLVAGEKLTLVGHSLLGVEGTQVVFNDLAPETLSAANGSVVTDQKIEVTVPGTLPEGPNTVQILHLLRLSANQEIVVCAKSNVMAFVLMPVNVGGTP